MPPALPPSAPSGPDTDASGRSPGPVLGLLGGIASGKSAVARILAGESGTVLDADAHAREVLESPAVIQAIVKAWGPGVLLPAGGLSRPALAQRVFRDAAARRWFEGLTHPLVRARIMAALDEARSLGRGPIVLDVPLLLETSSSEDFAALCDSLIFVASDPEDREQRARESRGWPAGEVARREAAQLPLSEKRARAHYIINNQGDLRELEHQTRKVLRELDGSPS
ncbi:MAG TPA: dephospho-CoA kinase [Planctomycetota bacterium]|nr:dephospho-CoA kinase [Planctomycetota bacterium]